MIDQDLRMRLDDLDMDELCWAVHKLKWNKTLGPDQLPVEVYKDIDAMQL